MYRTPILVVWVGCGGDKEITDSGAAAADADSDADTDSDTDSDTDADPALDATGRWTGDCYASVAAGGSGSTTYPVGFAMDLELVDAAGDLSGVVVITPLTEPTLAPISV